MQANLSTQVKVGIFVFVTLVSAFLLTFWFGEYGHRIKGYHIYAEFRNAYGVVQETPVYIAGIKVGQVTSKTLKDGKAIVEIIVFSHYRIPKDSVATIRMRGMLGDKYIHIKPGSPESGYLKEGDYIKTEEGVSDVEELLAKLSQIADNLEKVTASLKEALGTEEGAQSIKEIVESIRRFTSSLSERMTRNEENIDSIVKDLREIARYLRVKAPELSEKVENAADQIAGLLSDVRESAADAVQAFRNTAREAQEVVKEAKLIVQKINSGKGVLGKLISDEEMGEKLKKTVSALSDTLEGTSRFSIQLLYRGEFDPTGNIGHKNIFGIKFMPRKNKFYLVEIASVPEYTVKERTVTTVDANGNSTTTTYIEQKKELKFSIEIGYRFGPVTLRGGLIQSTGGIGVDASFWQDKITLTFDAYDFTKNTNPNLKFGLQLIPWKYFYLYGGVDDTINSAGKRRYFIGGGVLLTDDDLKKLLGLAVTATAVTQ